MAYIIGLVSDEEKKRLERLGWEFEPAVRVADEIKTPEAGKLCPLCNQANIEDNGEIALCPLCDHRWASRQNMVGCWVDNDLFAIMTGPDWETNDPWSNDLVQFARLLDEVHTIIEPKDLDKLAEHMDLDRFRVQELFDRAGRACERLKPTVDFREQMADYLRRGLEPTEILERLDPDTAGEDLIELVKTLMAPGTVYCKFCHKPVTEIGAHRHQDGWVGECCWDERLRSGDG